MDECLPQLCINAFLRDFEDLEFHWNFQKPLATQEPKQKTAKIAIRMKVG